MDVIAEQRLDVAYPDGERVAVWLRVGRPQPSGGGEWQSAVQAEGLRMWEGPAEMSGEGSFHAPVIAVGYPRRILSYEVEDGAVLHLEGGSEVLRIDELFATPARPE